MGDTSAPPAGWFPDPDGARAWRWWNGESWDERTTPFPGPAQALAAPAPWLSWLAALSPALGVLAGAVIQRAYGSARAPLEEATSSGSIHWSGPLVAVVVAALVGLASELVVVAWLLRCGRLARSLGYRLGASPALGAWTWLVPIVKLFLPYRLLRDLSPEGHPLRDRVRASWMALVAYQLASLALGLGTAEPSMAATVVVAALGLAWCATFAPVVLSSASGLTAAAEPDRRGRV